MLCTWGQGRWLSRGDIQAETGKMKNQSHDNPGDNFPARENPTAEILKWEEAGFSELSTVPQQGKKAKDEAAERRDAQNLWVSF